MGDSKPKIGVVTAGFYVLTFHPPLVAGGFITLTNNKVTFHLRCLSRIVVGKVLKCQKKKRKKSK